MLEMILKNPINILLILSILISVLALVYYSFVSIKYSYYKSYKKNKKIFLNQQLIMNNIGINYKGPNNEIIKIKNILYNTNPESLDNLFFRNRAFLLMKNDGKNPCDMDEIVVIKDAYDSELNLYAYEKELKFDA